MLINGQQIPSPSTKLKNGDIVSHTLHRHEPPVTAEPIRVVHEDDDLIVINKPAGIPVHPSGRYNYNSITEIMRAERSYTFNPLPCNRLDRLTSGVMFIGKHRSAADKMTVAIKQRSVRKEYLARVVGRFPEGAIVVDKPILQISPRLGLNQVRANGKAARTVFRRLAYYAPSASSAPRTAELAPPSPAAAHDHPLPWDSAPGYSVVHCLPLTGRTHQLRVHLQYVGHPISNDPIYANQRVFGPGLGAGDRVRNDNAAGVGERAGEVRLEGGSGEWYRGKEEEEEGCGDASLMARLERMGKEEVADAMAYHDDIRAKYEARKAEKMNGERCEICGTELYSDPGAHELGIYLHALRYADLEGRWGYETGLPRWALPEKGREKDGPGEEEIGEMLRSLREESGELVADVGKLSLDGDGLEGDTANGTVKETVQ